MFTLKLREVLAEDLSIFFKYQLDEDANHMAAFTRVDPGDREAFNAHWDKIRSSESVVIRTIIYAGQVVGSVLSYEQDGRQEVSYWIGKANWGKGIATRALQDFLDNVNKTRPIYARVAKDNIGSRHVLEKCGFKIIQEGRGFANARGAEISELLYERL